MAKEMRGVRTCAICPYYRRYPREETINFGDYSLKNRQSDIRRDYAIIVSDDMDCFALVLKTFLKY